MALAETAVSHKSGRRLFLFIGMSTAELQGYNRFSGRKKGLQTSRLARTLTLAWSTGCAFSCNFRVSRSTGVWS